MAILFSKKVNGYDKAEVDRYIYENQNKHNTSMEHLEYEIKEQTIRNKELLSEKLSLEQKNKETSQIKIEFDTLGNTFSALGNIYQTQNEQKLIDIEKYYEEKNAMLRKDIVKIDKELEILKNYQYTLIQRVEYCFEEPIVEVGGVNSINPDISLENETVVGKIMLEDFFDDDGNVIYEKGTIVDSEILSSVEKMGKVMELFRKIG